MFISDEKLFADAVSEDYEDVESIVDDSYFVPMSEVVKQVTMSRDMSDVEIRQLYDFPDGVADDREFGRAQRGQDIAELSQEIHERQKNVKSAIDDARAQDRKNKEFQERLNKISQ